MSKQGLLSIISVSVLVMALIFLSFSGILFASSEADLSDSTNAEDTTTNPVTAHKEIDSEQHVNKDEIIAQTQTQAQSTPSILEINKQISLSFALGAPPFPPCGSPHYAEPTIVEIPYARISPARQTTFRYTQGCVCGYKEDENLTISVLNPSGRILSEKTVTVESNDRNPLMYCHVLSKIAYFEFLPNDLFGKYTVSIQGQDTVLSYTFDLVPASSPRIHRYTSREEGFILVGFNPFEEVRILEYDLDDDRSGKLKFIGESLFNLDEKGSGIWTNSDPEVTLFVVRDDLSFVSTYLGDLTWIKGSPINYDKIIETNSNKVRV